MENELELQISEEMYAENTGTLSADIKEIAAEFTTEEKNTQLLEQINAKLDLLLSMKEAENHG